ncbi:unnamed protein product, partial [Amoebophrya sp. A120]
LFYLDLPFQLAFPGFPAYAACPHFTGCAPSPEPLGVWEAAQKMRWALFPNQAQARPGLIRGGAQPFAWLRLVEGKLAG